MNTPGSSDAVVRRRPNLANRRQTLADPLPRRPLSGTKKSFKEFRRSSSLPGVFDPTRPQDRVSSSVLMQTRNYHLECERQGIIPAKRELVNFSLAPFCATAKPPMLPGASKVALPSFLVGDRQVIAWCNSGLLDGRSELKLHHAQLADAGVSAIATRLKDKIETIDIVGNAFGVPGAEALGRAHMRQLETLVLSNNGLGDLAIIKLFCGLSDDYAPQLVRLTLSDNNISYGARAIGTWLPTQRRLSFLDVHWNYIAGDGAVGLFEGMKENEYGCLSRLDIAWNCLANVGSAASIAVLAQALAKDCPLVHLDLSYNGLQPAECEVLGRGLRHNHSLLGLHLVGNAAEVDANGFVIARPNAFVELNAGAQPSQLLGERLLSGAQPPRELAQEERDSIRAVFDDIDTDKSGTIDPEEFQVAMKSMGMEKSIEEVTSLMNRNDANGDGVIDIDEFTALMESLIVKEQQKDWWHRRRELELQRDRSALETRTSCWICESWREVEFTWHGKAKAVWLYTSADGYRHPARMVDQGGGKHSCFRMLPPEEVFVILQVDEDVALIPGLPTVALSQPVTLRMRAADCRVLKGEGAFRTVEDASVMSLHLNCADEAKGCTHPKSDHHKRAVVVLDDSSGPKGFKVVPRRVELEVDGEKAAPTKWAFEKSIFSRRERPNQKQYDSCFESDWAHVKFRRFMKNEDYIDQAHGVLKRSYSDFLALYRRYASLSLAGASPFGVGMKPIHDLFGSVGISDATVCHSGEVETIFIAARVVEHRADKRPFLVKPGDTLLRFQFLEFLLRIAYVRYFQTEEYKSVQDALVALFGVLTPIISSAQQEREAFMREFETEGCDHVIRSHQETLDALYRTHCGLNKGMNRKQFEDLVSTAVTDRKKCGSKDMAYAFLLGSQIYPDELYDMEFAHLTLFEFYYCIGAIAFLMQRIDEEETVAQRMEVFIKGLAQGRVRNLLRIL